MHRSSSLVGLLVIAATPGAFADHLPGTLNFADVTSDRIVWTVGEMSSNEKEVDFGDFDNDGDLDVVVANAHSDFGQRRNKLYRNDDGVFNEVSGNPTIPGFSGTDVSRNAFFRDYDLDGWLDIIIVNDNNTAGDPGRTKIYINQHRGGVFSHYTEEGLKRLGNGTGGAACSGVSIDADMDGDWDLYVGNYPGPSQDTMYFNQNKNPGFFTQVTATHVPGDNDYTVDVSSADMNGDGTMDLLISNWGSNKLYYNNNNDGGSGVGDYSYSGSVQFLGTPGSNENAMEPADFDNDGDQDFYWTNKIGSADRIYQNTGNDANNKAVFVETSNLPPSVTGRVSRKATMADLNNDGRIDIVVGAESGGNSRPTVLRNTTVHGQISFIDWTPGDEFPNTSIHRGWHAAVFDSNGDGDADIFLGGWSKEHLFENVASNEADENDLPEGTPRILPPVYNVDPLAVLGHALDAEVDLYLANGIGSGAFMSIVLNGPDDYLLELLNDGGGVVGSSNRGGLGVEEAMQVNGLLAGNYTIRITVLEAGPNDSIFDLDDDGTVGSTDLLALLRAWGENPGHAADFNGDGVVGSVDLLLLLFNWGPVSLENDYILEVLSRN
ncbi:MAG: FG-GAP-like repeat-containing protein [Phycisphaerales bacterium]